MTAAAAVRGGDRDDCAVRDCGCDLAHDQFGLRRNTHRRRGAPLRVGQAVRIQLFRWLARRRPDLHRRLGHRQHPVPRRGADETGMAPGGNAEGPGRGGMRVAPGHPVRAVLQSRQDGRPQLPRIGVRLRLRLLRLHPSHERCRRERAPALVSTGAARRHG